MDYAEDHDLWCRIAVSHAVAILPERLVAYRYHPQQATFRKIREGHRATLACCRRAQGAYVAAGLLQQADRFSTPSIWATLRGTEGTLGKIYVQWANLYGWALRQPRKALTLCSMAILSSPLNGEAWRTLVRIVPQVLLRPSALRAVHWYGNKVRDVLCRRSARD